MKARLDRHGEYVIIKIELQIRVLSPPIKYKMAKPNINKNAMISCTRNIGLVEYVAKGEICLKTNGY